MILERVSKTFRFYLENLRQISIHYRKKLKKIIQDGLHRGLRATRAKIACRSKLHHPPSPSITSNSLTINQQRQRKGRESMLLAVTLLQGKCRTIEFLPQGPEKKEGWIPLKPCWWSRLCHQMKQSSCGNWQRMSMFRNIELQRLLWKMSVSCGQSGSEETVWAALQIKSGSWEKEARQFGSNNKSEKITELLKVMD